MAMRDFKALRGVCRGCGKVTTYCSECLKAPRIAELEQQLSEVQADVKLWRDVHADAECPAVVEMYSLREQLREAQATSRRFQELREGAARELREAQQARDEAQERVREVESYWVSPDAQAEAEVKWVHMKAQLDALREYAKALWCELHVEYKHKGVFSLCQEALCLHAAKALLAQGQENAVEIPEPPVVEGVRDNSQGEVQW